MSRSLLRAAGARLSAARTQQHVFSVQDVVWAMGSFCALNRKPFDGNLLIQRFPPLYSSDSFIRAARALGFRIKRIDCNSENVATLNFPYLVGVNSEQVADHAAANDEQRVPTHRPAIVAQVNDQHVILFEAGSNTPKTITHAKFDVRFAGTAFPLALANQAVNDPNGTLMGNQSFGFRWFIPELLKHRRAWRDVLIASLVIQLLALGSPLCTQAVNDKVVVHRTESTLLVIAIGMCVFMLFTALLTWTRQYLVLHTGNRVDAALGSAVFNHLFKRPPRYFEHRPNGVITSRSRGVENIREFVSSAAVTLVLDLPFLLIFVGVMFYYDVTLTLIALSLTGIMAIMGPSGYGKSTLAKLLQGFYNRLTARSSSMVTTSVICQQTSCAITSASYHRKPSCSPAPSTTTS